GIRERDVTGVQTCALPISRRCCAASCKWPTRRRSACARTTTCRSWSSAWGSTRASHAPSAATASARLWPGTCRRHGTMSLWTASTCEYPKPSVRSSGDRREPLRGRGEDGEGGRGRQERFRRHSYRTGTPILVQRDHGGLLRFAHAAE